MNNINESRSVCLVAGAVEVPNTQGIGSGGSTHVIEVAKGLIRQGHQVTLFCARGAGQERNGKLEMAVIRRTFIWRNGLGAPKKNENRITENGVLEICRTAYRIGRSLWQARQILLELRGQDVNIVYERVSKSTVAGTVVALWKRAGLIAEVNDLSFNLGSLLVARRIVTPNPDVLPRLVRHKCTRLPWGVDTIHFCPQPKSEQLVRQLGLSEKKVVLFTGSCLPWHGLLDLVEAADHVIRHCEQVVFLVVGDGPTRRHAERRVEEKGLAEYFRFTGFIPYEQVPSYMALADMGVAAHTSALGPNTMIMSPLKILEYMAMELPTVVSSAGNFLRFVEHGVHGIEVQPGNIGQLAESIGSLLENPVQRRAMGRRAREKCESEFSWQAHCVALERLIEEVRLDR